MGRNHLQKSAVLTLEDVQPLFGGMRVTLYGDGKIKVVRSERGGERLAWEWEDRGRVGVVWRLLLAEDFLTIEPEERPGQPDEARPSLTLRNHFGKSHTIAKWAGVQSPRFDRIYQALLAIADAANTREPLPQREIPWHRYGRVAGGLLFVGLTLLLAHQIVRWIIGPVHDPQLTLVWLAGTAVAILLLLGYFLFKRRKEAHLPKSTSQLPGILLYLLALLASVVLIGGIFVSLQLVILQWGHPAAAVVQGKEIRVSVDLDTGDTTHYLITYTYTTASGVVTAVTSGVSRQMYQTVAEGDSLSIKYLPIFPGLFSVIETEENPPPQIAAFLTAQIVILFWLLGYGYWRARGV